MSSFYQPSAEVLQALGFTRYNAPAGQTRYSRPSDCGQETIVMYEDAELSLLESVQDRLLYSFQGRVASEAEFRVLLRQVNWSTELPISSSSSTPLS